MEPDEPFPILEAEGPAMSEQVVEQLERIETLLRQLVSQRSIKDWYTIAEAAQILGRAEFTVREWCRLGRVYASKRACGRGHAKEWIISHEELTRIQNEGLLPT
jgi:DNA-directed RNA polymerase specialized sigma24 family protein